MSRTAVPSHLSDAQIDRLEALLEQRAVPFKGLNLEALDGFLSAIVVGPETVPAAEWQAVVWGPNPPRWANAEEQAEVESLLEGHFNAVSKRVRYDGEELPEHLSPLIGLPEDPMGDHPDEVDIGHDWAFGFFTGVNLRGEAWDRWFEAEDWIDEIAELIERLATGEILAAEPADPPTPVSYRERLEIIASIPDMLADLHHHRIEQASPRQPVRKAAAPGRNDPCACGSGKKFKNCCGKG